MKIVVQFAESSSAAKAWNAMASAFAGAGTRISIAHYLPGGGAGAGQKTMVTQEVVAVVNIMFSFQNMIPLLYALVTSVGTLMGGGLIPLLGSLLNL